MNRFVYDIPTKVFFGEGQIKHLNTLANSIGKNVLLIYGGGSIKRSGLYETVRNHLSDFNLFELSGIESNPKIDLIKKGVTLCKENKIDLILAVGGGSVIDSGKLISAAALYDGDSWDLVEDPKLISSSLPLITIVTIAATGSEMNGNAVISNPETREKINLYSYHFFPEASICDPTYTYKVPALLTAAGAVDSMAHVIEVYFQKEQETFIQDKISEAVMEACLHYLPIALENPDNYEARANLMWASTTALNRLTSYGKRGEWSFHHIEHIISAYYDVPHALGIAILLPRWMAYTLNDQTVDLFAKYAANVWGISSDLSPYEMAEEAIRRTYTFIEQSGLPLTLPEVNVTSEDLFEEMARKAEPDLKKSFVPLGSSDVVRILQDCMTVDVTLK